jgi:hypothetical protein
MKLFLRNNWFLAAVLIVSALLLFLNLDDRVFFVDETETVMVGKTILEYGYPYPFYSNYDINPKAKHEVFGTILFNWNTWIPYYFSSGMHGLFGLEEFWQRFPFALFGLATIALFYFFANRLTNNFSANLATVLLATSVTFLLHMRQSRWYAVSTFFALAAFYSYWLWIKDDKKPNWFVTSVVFLFHSQLLIFFAVMFALAGYHILFVRRSKALKDILVILGAIAILTLPWFILTGQFSGKSGGITLNPLEIGINLGLYGYYSLVLLVPLLVVLPFVILLVRRNKQVYTNENIYLLFILGASVFFVSLKSDLLPAIRYLVSFIPIISLLNAQALEWFRKRFGMLVVVILTIVIIFTNFLNVVPIAFGKPVFEQATLGRSSHEIADFLDSSLAYRFFLFDYVYEITHDYTGADDEIVSYLQRFGNGDDYFVAVYPSRTILLYTGMNVGIPDKRAESFYRENSLEVPTVVPEWIISRDSILAAERNEKFLSEVDELYDLTQYEEIVIPINDRELWADSPDPVNHQFKTDRGGSFTIYHRK